MRLSSIFNNSLTCHLGTLCVCICIYVYIYIYTAVHIEVNFCKGRPTFNKYHFRVHV
jgi:hypothetical protein